MADVVTTKNYNLSAKFDEFNAKYFDGRLDKIRVEWADLPGAHALFQAYTYGKTGGYVASKAKILMDNRYERTERLLDGNLIHEMVHQWVAQVLRNPQAENGGHNDQFYAKCEEIQKRAGFNIPINEEDASDTLGASEIEPVSMVLLDSIGGNADRIYFAVIANREADELQSDGRDVADSTLKSMLQRLKRTDASAVIATIRDPDIALWWLEASQRVRVYDGLHELQTNSFYSSSELSDKLRGFMAGGPGATIIAQTLSSTPNQITPVAPAPEIDAPAPSVGEAAPKRDLMTPFPNLPSAEQPNSSNAQRFLYRNVFGQGSGVEYPYVLAGVTSEGLPTLQATDDLTELAETGSDYFVNITVLAKGSELKANRGADFARALSRITVTSVAQGKSHNYSGQDIRTCTQLAMENGLFAQDRLTSMLSWLNGMNPAVSIDVSKLTASNIIPWFREAVYDATSGDQKFTAFVALACGLGSADGSLYLADRVLMMRPDYRPGMAMNAIPLLSYLVEVFPEKFYTNIATSDWSDDDFDRVFSNKGLLKKYKAQGGDAGVVEAPPKPEKETSPVDAPVPETILLHTNPDGDPYDRYSIVVLDKIENGKGFIKQVQAQDAAELEQYREAMIFDRNDPKYQVRSFDISVLLLELDAVLRRFDVRITKEMLLTFVDSALDRDDFELVDSTRVKTLEQWFYQWFGETFKFDTALPYTKALLQLAGAITNAKRDDPEFNRYVLKEMRIGDGKDSRVHNAGLMAQLMWNGRFGSSTDSLGLWLLRLLPPVSTELMDAGLINYEAISYTFSQTSVATLRERWLELQKPPTPSVIEYTQDDVTEKGYKPTPRIFDERPDAEDLRKVQADYSISKDDYTVFLMHGGRWQVFLNPGVTSPVLEPESTVRAPKVTAPTGARSNLQMVPDPETKRLVLRVEPGDEPEGKNRMGQVGKREARPIAALLNVVMANDLDAVLDLIKDGRRKEAAQKAAHISARMLPYFKRTVEEKQPFAGLQPWIDANFGEGLQGQKAAMYALEGQRAKLTTKQRQYLTQEKNKREIFGLLGIKWK
jgi:hypothetical protein